jgi:hypothetical protein
VYFVVCTLAVKKNQGRFRHVGSDHSLVSLFQSPLAVAWYRLPNADVPLPLGSRTLPGLRNSSQRLNPSSSLTNITDRVEKYFIAVFFFALKACLFAGPLPSSGCCIVAYFTVVV